MYIHHYTSTADQDKDHPYVCAFYTPYDPKFTTMKQWLKKTFEHCDVVDLLEFGEVRFKKQKDSALFVLRWA